MIESHHKGSSFPLLQKYNFLDRLLNVGEAPWNTVGNTLTSPQALGHEMIECGTSNTKPSAHLSTKKSLPDVIVALADVVRKLFFSNGQSKR